MTTIPEDVLIRIEETANFLKQNGVNSLEQLKSLNKNNPNFSFLFPDSPYYSYFNQRVESKFQTNPNMHPSSPLANIQSQLIEGEKKKPSSRWGASVQYPTSNDASNYSPQKQGNYPVPQPGSPMSYNAHNLPVMGNMNPIYPNYYNNPQQGQFFNTFNFNQQGLGAANVQAMPGFSNYNIGNTPSPPAQGMPHGNPMMMFGNSSASTAPLPNYMNPLPGQARLGERKASLDKKEPGSGMETESPKSK